MQPKPTAAASVRTCLRCGNRSVVPHGGGWRCRDCGADEPADAAASRENRIRANRVLIESLVALWEVVPEWRFGQLVMNLSRTEGGFADTWEWSNADWRERIEKLYYEYAGGHRV